MNLQILRCTLLTCLITLAVCSAASAQATFGLKISSGLNVVYEQFYEHQNTSSWITVGIGGTLNIPLTDAFVLQPEINYLTNPGDPFQFNAFAVPILLRYKLAPKISIEAGPSLQREFYRKYYSSGSTPYLNIGTNAGASFWFNDQFSANLRYTYEVFRTAYNMSISANDPHDELLMLTSGPEPGFRDTYITASLQYSFK